MKKVIVLIISILLISSISSFAQETKHKTTHKTTASGKVNQTRGKTARPSVQHKKATTKKTIHPSKSKQPAKGSSKRKTNTSIKG